MYLPAYGRFASPDPAYDQNAEDTQSWNLYGYVRNSPLMSIDPTGETIYAVTYTRGNTHGDEEMKRAAQTRADELGKAKTFDATKDIVVLRGITSKNDLVDLGKKVKGMEKQFGKVGQFIMFSHASESGIWLHTSSGAGVSYSGKEIGSAMGLNWEKGAKAYFLGCRTAQFMTQSFANSEHVKTFGLQGYGQFSKRTDRWNSQIFGSSGPLYLVDPIRKNGGPDWFTGTYVREPVPATPQEDK